jgi:valyl-tRNA synthetase
MPFVAESIWHALNEVAFERGLPAPEPSSESVVIAPWPEFPAEWQDPAMERRMARMQDLVRAVREVRNRYSIDNRTPLDVFIRCDGEVADDFRQLAPFITLLAGVGKLESGSSVTKPPQAATHVHADFEAYVSLAGLIDVPAEIARLEKQREDKRKFLQGLQAKLANINFTSKAPQEVVQEQRDRAADAEKQIQAIEENLRELRQE